MEKTALYIALPILNERSNLDRYLACLKKQDFQNFVLVACVNNDDVWWNIQSKRRLCEDNQQSIQRLKSERTLPIEILDYSSPGRGWPSKKGGVGMARKKTLDYIATHADQQAIMVSMDADTDYPHDYLRQILLWFQNHPDKMGLSLPYYHPLTGEHKIDRLILRYEMYMRYYALNMIRIHNPYCYTALGSAMAFPVWAYQKVGGLTPVKSGEDFYFLQKLVKAGEIGYTANTQAYPATRYSDRVLFGTGPALLKGKQGDWHSYPFYPPEFFDAVEQTYASFPALFQADRPTPMDQFLKLQFKQNELWQALRKNYKDVNNFVKACSNKVDGLRILQYLKRRADNHPLNDEKVLTAFILQFAAGTKLPESLQTFDQLGFGHTPIDQLNDLRNFLFRWETAWRNPL
jgi:hypothetical protein